MMFSSDLAFTDFLQSRNPDRVARERVNPPMARIRCEVYEVETESLLDALRSGSHLKLRIALTGHGWWSKHLRTLGEAPVAVFSNAFSGRK